jgi:hypothetical protein
VQALALLVLEAAGLDQVRQERSASTMRAGATIRRSGACSAVRMHQLLPPKAKFEFASDLMQPAAESVSQERPRRSTVLLCT